MGFMFVPSQNLHDLVYYLKQKEKSGDLFIHKLSQVTDSRISGSLALYKAEKGWSQLSQTKLKILKRQLRATKSPKRGLNPPLPSLLTTPYNQSWNYLKHPHPNQIIHLFCEISKSFCFKSLPWDLSGKYSKDQYVKLKLNLLKELFHLNVVQITFFPSRMINEFSLNDYWIIIPLIPYKQLLRLLYWLPTAYLIYTSEGIHLWTRLTLNLAEWLKEELNRSIQEIYQQSSPLRLLKEFYNEEICNGKFLQFSKKKKKNEKLHSSPL